jgi:hypothetical protein
MPEATSRNWPSARLFTEAMQCPSLSFLDPQLRSTVAAVDRLGMPLVTSGQFAYVFKLKSEVNSAQSFAVRCFRGHLGDREQRYAAINRHLKSHKLPALAGFSYEPEGVLVSGVRYPILIMEWIDGPTLDVYLDEVVDRREVVLHLANEWIKLVKTLHDAEIAHGDLQHGNIIVERGTLRLVDLDGMFVPEMAGWNASELGHQHFQHPARNAGWFDGTLDNFSSIVVYLSLISLAERPGLWAKYHDENLLFTKTDFLDAANSPLLAELKEIGPQHRNLADILVTAIENGLGEVPCLLDLVDIESNLPGWITGPAGIEVEGRTREAVRVVAYADDPAHSRWKSWDPNQAPTFIPSGAGGIQGGLSGQMVTIATPVPVPQTFTGISKAAVGNAKELLVNGFLWWYWGVFIVLIILGLEFLYALPVAILIVAIISVIYGYIRAYNDSAAGVLVQPLFPNKPHPTTRWTPTLSANAGSSMAVVAPLPPAQPSSTHSIVGNRALGIYHLAGCAWVMKIAASNRVGFISRVDAESAGYRSCKVCTP